MRKIENHRLDTVDPIQLKESSVRDLHFPSYDPPGMGLLCAAVSDGASAITTARPLYVRD